MNMNMKKDFNAGVGRRLSEKESREKTKHWPKVKKGEDPFKSGRQSVHGNYPPGFDETLLD